VGLLSELSGLGQSARSLQTAFTAQGTRVEPIDLGTPADVERARAAAGPSVNLVHLNADAMRRTHALLGPDFYRERLTIGYWYWELADFRYDWRHAFRYVHEVWVPTDFVRRALLPHAGDVPVVCLPPPVTAPSRAAVSRSHFGLPDDRCLFLFAFDAASQEARKNPDAVIAAFVQAAVHPRAHLVIKVMNREAGEGAWRRHGQPGVTVLDAALPADEMGALWHLADCYVSLHRAEGFGLTVAEALAAGRPAIATAYGGLTDYLDEAVGWPVPYREVPITEDCGPYLAGWRWAEPDIAAAAHAMYEAATDAAGARARGSRGRDRMQQRYGLEPCGAACCERLIDRGPA
jgi:glycosyltransferase involved in cell wall biosynthesis